MNGEFIKPTKSRADLMMEEEMCKQFARLFPQQEKGYWGEKALLKVLLHREGETQSRLLQSEKISGQSLQDEHVRTRAMIFVLLGQRSAATELMGGHHKGTDAPKNWEDSVLARH